MDGLEYSLMTNHSKFIDLSVTYKLFDNGLVFLPFLPENVITAKGETWHQKFILVNCPLNIVICDSVSYKTTGENDFYKFIELLEDIYCSKIPEKYW